MERYIKGYQFNNKPSDEKGFDINKLTWERKKILEEPNVYC